MSNVVTRGVRRLFIVFLMFNEQFRVLCSADKIQGMNGIDMSWLNQWAKSRKV